METSLDWSRYFDSIVCVHYRPYDNRLNRLKEETARVGLAQSRLFSISTIDKIDGVDSYHNLGFHTARIMDRFLDTAGRRLCVIENDVAFLKDLALLDAVFNDMPESGIIQLDKFCPWGWGVAGYRAFVEKNSYSKYFFRSDSDRFEHGEFLAGGSFYVVDRDSAYKLRTRMINGPTYPDPQFRDLGVPVYTSDPNGSIQIMFEAGASADKWCWKDGHRFRNSHTLGYASIGLKYSDYGVPEGYDESSLFYSV